MLQGHVSVDGAKKKIEALKIIADAIMVFRAVDYLERALEMALKERITVYDAAYIALAEDKSTVLYTSDREQYSVARKYVKAVYVG